MMKTKIKKTFLSTAVLASLVTTATISTNTNIKTNLEKAVEENNSPKETFGVVPVVTDPYERVNFGDPDNNTLAYQAQVVDNTASYHLVLQLFTHQETEDILISSLFGEYTSIIRLGAEMFDGNNETYDMLDQNVEYHDLYYKVSILAPVSNEVVSTSITPSRAYLVYANNVWNVEEEMPEDVPYLEPVVGTYRVQATDTMSQLIFSIQLAGDEFLYNPNAITITYNTEVYSTANNNLIVELDENMVLTATLTNFNYVATNTTLFVSYYNTYGQDGYLDAYAYNFENILPTINAFDFAVGNKWGNVSYSIDPSITIDEVTLKATTLYGDGTTGEYSHSLGSASDLATTVKDLDENTWYLDAHLEIKYDGMMIYSTEDSFATSVQTGSYLAQPTFFDFDTIIATDYLVDPGLREFTSIVVECSELGFYQTFEELTSTIAIPNPAQIKEGTFDYTISFADGGTEVYHYSFSFS